LTIEDASLPSGPACCKSDEVARASRHKGAESWTARYRHGKSGVGGVSTQKQGRSGLGLEAQRKAVASFAEAEAFEIVAEFTEVETGKGSDALDRRPQLKAALKAAKKVRCEVARLPYGLQKRVELGRALAAEPTILLLDEPMAGMNIEEKQDMCRFILDVNDHYGTTIVLIEHDMGVVMDISDRVVVLDYGKKIGDGTPDEVRSDQNVIDAYLGVPH
jgi:ABC-type branched-subunit amino acid transport system ATPase component